MRIIIDPGHGGKDPGAVGIGGRREKDITLTICHYIAGILLHGGHDPMLTRYRDTDISSGKRASFAKNNGGQLFVSVHCNSFHDAGANGMEVFHHPAAGEKSKQLATNINKIIAENTSLRNRGVKSGNLQVLRETHNFMPSVLVEIGFISNQSDLEFISSLVGQWRLANYIAKGIMDFISL